MSKMSGGRKLLLYISMFLLMGLFIEVLATVLVYQNYHRYISESIQYKGRSATGYLLKKLLERINPPPSRKAFGSTPEPFRVPDSLHGYRIGNGSFEVFYQHGVLDTVERFKYYVTIKDDGSRYVGTPPFPTERDVYVFGDSFIFGEGVNDEQTFTYLLQSRFPNTRFHLYANPGHSLTNAHVNFQRLAPKIGREDVVILGYAYFYDERHVASPVRMKYWGQPHSHKSQDPKSFKHLRARLIGDSLVIDKIPLFCEYLGDYCNQPEPQQSYMDSVTARLINDIAKSTEAQVYLLHFQGNLRKEMTAMVDPRVRICLATPETFDYKYRDDINGFDRHPGPYWNHAIYRRLSDTLRSQGYK